MFSKLLGRCDTRRAVASPVKQDSMDSDYPVISNVKSSNKISEKLTRCNMWFILDLGNRLPKNYFFIFAGSSCMLSCRLRFFADLGKPYSFRSAFFFEGFMVTIYDIAEATGYSAPTVSKALNGLGSLSEETRQRIINKAKELGYEPNISARTLTTKKS